jgi:hypothetical protein
VVLAAQLRGTFSLAGFAIMCLAVSAEFSSERLPGLAVARKIPAIFYFRAFLNPKIPYFCNPFWGIFLLSSVG